MNIKEILDIVEKEINSCTNNEESYLKFLDMLIDEKLGPIHYKENLKELKIWLAKDQNNLVCMLAFISSMAAFHPSYLPDLMSSPSQIAVQKHFMQQLVVEIFGAAKLGKTHETLN